MKTGTFVDFFPGGFFGALFAGCAAIFLVTTGIQTHRVTTKQARINTLEAQAKTWAGAQKTNLDTIKDLKARIDGLVAAWTFDQNEARAAAERAARANEATNKQLAATRAELGEVYARNPSARAWGAVGVDPAVAARLPAGGRAH